jgi:hypothetical protein
MAHAHSEILPGPVGSPRANEMGEPSRGRGGAAHEGEREGSPLAQTTSYSGGAARERCAALRLIFFIGVARPFAEGRGNL